MWSPILEKAWAKVKGNYESSQGGFNVSGLRAITGAPVFTYKTSDIDHEISFSKSVTFDLLKAANDASFPLSASTDGSDNSIQTTCGLYEAHSYSILEIFELQLETRKVKMLLMRDPFVSTNYSGPWSHDDPNWTDALIA